VLGLDRECDCSFSLNCFGFNFTTSNLNVASTWGECHTRLDLGDFVSFFCVEVNFYRVSCSFIVRLHELLNLHYRYFVILSVSAAGLYCKRILHHIDDHWFCGVYGRGRTSSWIFFELSVKSEYLLGRNLFYSLDAVLTGQDHCEFASLV